MILAGLIVKMFSCKKASFLISKSLDRPLSRGEWFSMRFHLLICRICRNFRRSLLALQNQRRLWDEQIDHIHYSEKLSPEAKKKIADQIRREMN